MTKWEGHYIMTNYFGHWLSGQSTSDPTWPILRGEIMTKLEGHRSESAQSTVAIHMGQAQQFSLFRVFFLLLYTGQPNISAQIII